MRVYRCVTSVWVAISQGEGVILRAVGISVAVKKGRLPRNCIYTACVSLRFLDAIPRNDGVYSAGIKNNTRRVVVPVRVYCYGYQQRC